MQPVAEEIAARATSLGGLRAKALVALWEALPASASHDGAFDFPDASRSLFDAVAEMTGLTPLVRELEARLNATPRRGTQLLLTLPLGPFDEGLHFPKLPNASTMNATMTTQNANAYVLTYSIGVNALTMASTATSTESTNIHIDGGLWQVTTPSALASSLAGATGE